MSLVLHDHFTGSASTDLNGNTPDTVGTATWNADTKIEYQGDSTARLIDTTSIAPAYIDAGVADFLGEWTVIVPNYSGSSRIDIVFRHTDANNYWFVRIDGAATTFQLWKNEASSFTPYGSAITDAALSKGSTQTVRVYTSGNRIAAWCESDGCLKTTSNAFNATASNVGVDITHQTTRTVDGGLGELKIYQYDAASGGGDLRTKRLHTVGN